MRSCSYCVPVIASFSSGRGLLLFWFLLSVPGVLTVILYVYVNVYVEKGGFYGFSCGCTAFG